MALGGTGEVRFQPKNSQGLLWGPSLLAHATRSFNIWSRGLGVGGHGVGECWSWICRSGARSRQNRRQQTAYLSSMQMSVLSLLTPSAQAGCLLCTACLGRNLFRRSCLGRSVNFFLRAYLNRALNRDLLFSVMLFKALAPK